MTATKRKRRTPDQVIADLQARIEAVKERQADREMKGSPSLSTTMKAIRALDKALETAAAERSSELQEVLANGRKPITDFLLSRGLRLPKARTVRRPRARSA